MNVIAQIEGTGFTISPNWFFGSIITVLLLMIGFFLKRNLDTMDSMLKKHDEQLNDHETRIQLAEQRDEDITSKVANEIWMKIKSITPE